VITPHFTDTQLDLEQHLRISAELSASDAFEGVMLLQHHWIHSVHIPAGARTRLRRLLSGANILMPSRKLMQEGAGSL
jgi:hypothetical protein